MLLQDAEKCVNWYPEVSQGKGSKTVSALLGCPGLQLALAVGNGPIRGMWALPGGASALVVSGSQCYLMTIHTTATATAEATFIATLIGTLNSSSGPVCIRDNGVGGIAVIVDGANGYVYQVNAKTLTQITDVAWLGSNRIAYVDGWLVFQEPGTQTFYTSPLYWNGTSAMDPTYYALKDSSSDQLVTMYDDQRLLWLIGERTTEVWYDAGNATFPFSRLPGVTMQHGAAAPHSIARAGDSIVWLAQDEQGQNYVVRTVGYRVQPISTHAVAHAIASYNVVNDAIGYAYQDDGHLFYVLTFPTADATWVWDETSNLWHERMSYDPVAGLYHRHMSNCYMNFADQRLVGDYESGNIYQMTRSAYSDNGNPLVAWRRTPHAWDEQDRNWVFHSQLQIEFTPGVGLQSGQGSTPHAMLRWSDDGGQTYGNEHWQSIGMAGQTRNRCIWRRLGSSRDRIYDVKFSDPVPRDIVGASLVVVP